MISARAWLGSRGPGYRKTVIHKIPETSAQLRRYLYYRNFCYMIISKTTHTSTTKQEISQKFTCQPPL